jgi:uncharacterized phage-associated protein
MVTAVSVFDVAAYICREFKSSSPKLTAMKLQKLLYYCQAWSLVWNEEPIFSEEIEAWANGPVVKELYDWHRGMFHIESISKGNLSHLNKIHKDTIHRVLKTYGSKTAQWLSDLTHLESPWKEARNGLGENERGSNVITLAALHEYYSSLSEQANRLK